MDKNQGMFGVVFVLGLLVAGVFFSDAVRADTKYYKVRNESGYWGHWNCDGGFKPQRQLPEATIPPPDPFPDKFSEVHYNLTRVNDSLEATVKCSADSYSGALMEITHTTDKPINSIYINVTGLGTALDEKGYELYIMNWTNDTGVVESPYYFLNTTISEQLNLPLTYNVSIDSDNLDSFINSTTNVSVFQLVTKGLEEPGGGGSPQIWIDGKFEGEIVPWSIYPSLAHWDYLSFETDSTELVFTDPFLKEIAYIKDFKLYSIEGEGEFMNEHITSESSDLVLRSINNPKLPTERIRENSMVFSHKGGEYKLIIDAMQTENISVVSEGMFNGLGANYFDFYDKIFGATKDIFLNAMDRKLGAIVYVNDEVVGYLRPKGYYEEEQWQTYLVSGQSDDEILNVRFEYVKGLHHIGEVKIDNSEDLPYTLKELETDFVPFEVGDWNETITFEKGSGKYVLGGNGWFRMNNYITENRTREESLKFFFGEVVMTVFTSKNWVDEIVQEKGFAHRSIALDFFQIIVNYDGGTDNDPPNVTSFSPPNLTEFVAGDEIRFEYNYSEVNGVPECALYINGTKNESLARPDEYFRNNFSTVFAGANHTWTVGCEDEQGNVAHSLNLTLVNVPAPEDSCTCPVSGIWSIIAGDECTLDILCELGEDALHILDGVLRMLPGGAMSSTGCYVDETTGGFFIHESSNVSCGGG